MVGERLRAWGNARNIGGLIGSRAPGWNDGLSFLLDLIDAILQFNFLLNHGNYSIQLFSPNSNKTPNTIAPSRMNSNNALPKSVKAAAKNTVSDRKSRASSSSVNASNACLTPILHSSNSLH
jgi:hypothetical protein